MFSSYIRLLTKKQNKEEVDIADDAGLSEDTIKRASKASEIGNCKLGTLEKIADALKVNVKDLFEED